MAEEKKDMSFLEHLEELRGRLVRAAFGIVAGLVIVVVFYDFVVEEIIMGPTNEDFITYRMFCDWSHKMGMGEQFCFSLPDEPLQNQLMSGAMNASIMVCVLGGIILAFPWIILQLWGFIKPGLRQKEQKMVQGIVFFVSLLFFLGVSFGYFILAPLSFQFLINFTFADVQNVPTLSSYMKLTSSLVLGTGLVFQLPVLIYFLTKIGIASSAFLKKYRKHAFVANLIVAAIITPPDVTSQILVAMPILLLYEMSILIAARVEKKRALQEVS